jgi:4-hydroxybenzoate polyprenyltransferase
VKWSTALTLGRVSNLPTVWTNALAGAVLAGGSAWDARVPWILLAVSLCYVAGMFLNDAFDSDFDARHRPERPIPAGDVSVRTVFVAGFGMLAAGVALLAWLGLAPPRGTGWPPLAGGVLLAALIVFYDWHHKDNPLSPVVMGLCRLMVYVVAACVVTAHPPAGVFLVGLLLLCYLVGLTYVAKQEHLGRIGNLWPLAFLALPMLWGIRESLRGGFAALVCMLFVAWVLYSLSFVKRRRPGDVPRAVGALLAGICLWDALVIAAAGQTAVAVLALCFFLLTRVLQRYVAPT